MVSNFLGVIEKPCWFLVSGCVCLCFEDVKMGAEDLSFTGEGFGTGTDRREDSRRFGEHYWYRDGYESHEHEAFALCAGLALPLWSRWTSTYASASVCACARKSSKGCYCSFSDDLLEREERNVKA